MPGVLVIEPKVFGDGRGFFLETFQEERYREAGITKRFVQDNQSHSIKGVLRGLHYQYRNPQAKLVWTNEGEIFDVVVDIRKGSKTFGKWFGIVLSGDDHLQLYIPEGFAHGFCVISDEADFSYKCTDYYNPKAEYGVRWDDPQIGINWPLQNAILSKKDRGYPLLANVPENLLPKRES